jgi:hypothetical protein
VSSGGGGPLEPDRFRSKHSQSTPNRAAQILGRAGAFWGAGWALAVCWLSSLGPRGPQAPIGSGRVNGAGEGEGSGRHRTLPENLHSTTILARMARPVVSCMKSMVSTTGLALGAGVVVLCRFLVTLSTHSRHKAAQTTCTSARRPPAPANLGRSNTIFMPRAHLASEAGSMPRSPDPPAPSPTLSPCAVYRADRQARSAGARPPRGPGVDSPAGTATIARPPWIAPHN